MEAKNKVFVKFKEIDLKTIQMKLTFEEHIKPELSKKYSINYDSQICTIKTQEYGSIDLYLESNMIYFHDTQKTIKNGLLWIRKNLL
jgi:hypothetical protein